MGARAWQVAGVAIVLTFGGLALLTVAANGGVGPNSSVSRRCSMEAAPSVDNPHHQPMLIRSEALGFPLGVRCIFDSPLYESGPQVVVSENWGMTIIGYGSGLLAIGGLVLTMRATSELD